MSVKTVSSKLIIIVTLVLAMEISTARAKSLYFGKYIEIPNEVSTMANDEFNHIMQMLNAYREHERLSDTKNFGDIKYKAWKRNGDLINSLLALPMDMDEAGR